MDPEKLERIQLPVPTAAEKTTYNHLLAERLIRIMNNAAQPGARACGWFPGVGELQGPSPTPAPGAPAVPGIQAELSRSPAAHTPWAPRTLPSSLVFILEPPPLPVPRGVCARLSLSSPPILTSALVGCASVCSPPLRVAEATFKHEHLNRD